MRNGIRIVLATLLACGGCATPPAQVATAPQVTSPASSPAPAAPAGNMRVPLRNADFEAPMEAQARCAPAWSCKMHNDPNAFHFFLDEKHPAFGKRSLCIERTGREPWGAATQVLGDIGALRGRHVRFSAHFRVEGVVGDGGGAFILAQGGSGQALAHAQKQEQGTQYWRPLSVDLVVPREAFLLEVGLVLEGHGMACIDDAVLEVIPGP